MPEDELYLEAELLDIERIRADDSENDGGRQEFKTPRGKRIVEKLSGSTDAED